MSMRELDSLRHPPEVVVTFVKRLIDDYVPRMEFDRRSQPRAAIAIPIVVQPLDSDFRSAGKVFDAVTKDIFTGGIGLLHTEPVTASYLQIGISIHDGEKMSLLAQVRHCTPSGPRYHIGARFVVDWSIWRTNDNPSQPVNDDAAGPSGPEMRR